MCAMIDTILSIGIFGLLNAISWSNVELSPSLIMVPRSELFSDFSAIARIAMLGL
jgi:hypothetical protein